MAYLQSCYQTRARNYHQVLCKKSVTCSACIRSIPPRTILSVMVLWRISITLCKQCWPPWDVHLQQVLFAYRARPQSSIRELPCYMIYGRDPHLPTETAFSKTHAQYQVDAEDYCTELTRGLQNTWQVAIQNIGKAQCQKIRYDKEPKYQVGARLSCLRLMRRQTNSLFRTTELLRR